MAPLAGKKLNTKHLVDTTFWRNLFHLAKVLATTVHSLGKPLKVPIFQRSKGDNISKGTLM